MVASLWALGIAIALCFLVAEITRNYSQVDKLWSLLPILYAWLWTFDAGLPARGVLLSTLITLWGARLTFNFARKGGYVWPPWAGEEDYRWSVLRAKPLLAGPWRFGLFNFLFISLFQNALIFAMALPAWFAMRSSRPLGWIDALGAAVFLGFLIIETVSDQQMWNFQTEKHRLLKAGAPLEGRFARGFLHDGLFALCRHPNFVGEMGQWVTLWLFAQLVLPDGPAWTSLWGLGTLTLVGLFAGSTNFTESISKAKYADYRAYCRRVPAWIPGISLIRKPFPPPIR